MSEQERTGDDLRALAEAEMAEKREELGDDRQARELYDIPTESSLELAEKQESEQT